MTFLVEMAPPGLGNLCQVLHSGPNLTNKPNLTTVGKIGIFISFSHRLNGNERELLKTLWQHSLAQMTGILVDIQIITLCYYFIFILFFIYLIYLFYLLFYLLFYILFYLFIIYFNQLWLWTIL